MLSVAPGAVESVEATPPNCDACTDDSTGACTSDSTGASMCCRASVSSLRGEETLAGARMRICSVVRDFHEAIWSGATVRARGWITAACSGAPPEVRPLTCDRLHRRDRTDVERLD